MQNNAHQCAQTVMSAISWSITLSAQTCWCFSCVSVFQGPSLPQLGAHPLCQIWGLLIPSAQNVDITRSEVPMLCWLHLLPTLLAKPASAWITLDSRDGRKCKIHSLTATPEIFQCFGSLHEQNYIILVLFFFLFILIFFQCLATIYQNSLNSFRVWAFSPTQFIWVHLQLVHSFAEFVRPKP